VTLDLALASDPGTLDLWPHPFRLELTVSMGLTLEVALRMLNLSDQPVEITGALHTYLCTGAITQTFVHGLDGASYLDTIDGHQTKLQKGPVHFDQEVDRIYQTSQPVEVEDLKWKRTLRITNQGSHSTVVWNPWIEKSKRLPDLPDDAYPHFLCIEAANAGIDLVHLPPGGSHTLATRIEVR
jgi:glucose-6-phosphate 1-epimerase